MKDKDGIEITSIDCQMREGGPRAYCGLYVSNTGSASTFSMSVVTGTANHIAFRAVTGSCSDYPPTCTNLSYPDTVGVGTQNNVAVPGGAYTVRIVDAAADNSPVDIPLNATVATATPEPAVFSYGTESGCTNSDPVRYPGWDDTCTGADWRPPLDTFGRPASYVDGNFGGEVTKLCDDCNHAYSALTPFNSDSSKILIGDTPYSNYRVIDLSGNVIVSGVPSPGSAYWDASQQNVYYFCTSDGSQRIDKLTMDYGAGTFDQAPWVDFSGDFNPGEGCTTGGTGDNNRLNWLALLSLDGVHLCAVNLTTQYKDCIDISGIPDPFTSVDFSLISKGVDSGTGKIYVGVFGVPSMGVWSFNPQDATPTLAFEFRAGPVYANSIDYDGSDQCPTSCLTSAHSDTYEDENGVQHYVRHTQTSQEGARTGKWIGTYRFSAGAGFRVPEEIGGGWRHVFPQAIGEAGDPLHAACSKAASVCYYSIQSNPSTPYPGFTVIGATDASPIEITTSAAHGFITGATVNIGSVLGNTAANGIHTVTSTGASTFTLDGSSGTGAYTSGGVGGSGEQLDWTVPHRAQQLIFRLGATEGVMRMGMSRGTVYGTERASGYWSHPRGAISPDATHILWDTNFGEPNRPSVVIAPTGETPPAPGGPTVGLSGRFGLSGSATIK